MNKMLKQTNPDQIDPAEWDVRVKLAAAYRLVDYFGWCELIYGHLTARVPGPDHHFLINPYGLNYDEVTASNLVKIDLDGNKVDPECEHPVSVAGFVIHSAIHMSRSEQNQVVMHTHSRSGMAIAALEEGLLPVSMGSTALYGQVSYHDYEGVSLYLDERERLIAALGDNRSMILRNHGLLTTGSTVADAFLRHYRLERAAQVQLDASAAGRLRILDEATAHKSGSEVNQFAAMEDDSGALEYAALMRKLDKIDASYQH
ncbi:MAG: class II aldolase/adducin family protein [Granulosicoccus sp.]|nr:class II aldolase/adducin family protein [Granulosicoccus sp.]